jgi:ATP-dependent exoDNAse (exonuclease V) beta subunit
LIKGNVDRIEERNGVIRIIDYKTGKVEKSSDVEGMEGINRGDSKRQIIQVLAYAYMYETEAKSKPLRQELSL